MGLRQKLRIVNYFKTPSKIPQKIKDKYESHPQKQALNYTVFNLLFNKEYAMFEKALDKAIERKKLGFVEKNNLRQLTKLFQKAQDLTNQTKYCLTVEFPQIVKRACHNQTSQEDAENLTKVKEFLQWNKRQEKTKQLIKQKIF